MPADASRIAAGRALAVPSPVRPYLARVPPFAFGEFISPGFAGLEIRFAALSPCTRVRIPAFSD